ncbi:uroporphyrinogen-III synthase [Jatrophihabitans sp. GAS493]|uniref:uroporphyrinogen-III synthase n=1 Tax=Jatrophihabitans sp. GAS493 TaxID=1907575 RepID=UPI000BB97363|nr:uroporphyrinogen-III synthase [Jatrophihabitans sp. GAS493]SOD73950.1 uroporphyrinogen-III synthase [Jatrophihabitans sp. GAS493]
MESSPLAEIGPLAGYTVGVTAARRADEFGALLQRRGAAVMQAPAIRILPLADDAQLRQVTQRIIADPPQIIVATTGIGFRGWVEAAHEWDLADDLLDALSRARVLARGPKATGALRAAGLREEWSPASESSAEVLEHLRAEGVAGRRVAVQLHGATTEWEPLPDFSQGLRELGAEVTAIPVYRWTPPPDLAPLDRLLESTLCGTVDLLAFTSAPAVASMLGRARETGILERLLSVLRDGVVSACVGPVTAGPLEALAVPTVQPARFRLGALARLVGEELVRRTRVIEVGEHELSLRGQAVVLDGALRPISPAGMSLLSELAARPGQVVSQEKLLSRLPGRGVDTHAVESAVARLRSALGDNSIVQTVTKRGYRLAIP